MTYLPRDFIETSEGLIFAVVDAEREDGRVLCFLRYASVEGQRRKLGTEAAQAYLARHAPDYVFFSRRLDAPLHGVPISRIRRHYQPRKRVRDLLGAPSTDVMEAKALGLLKLLTGQGLDLEWVGLTGSLLIGAQTPSSDLDLVIYGREAFFAARASIRRLIEAGALQDLDDTAWREAYDRRGCTLSFEEYLWHERRKFNKGRYDGSKFDITLIGEELPTDTEPMRKLGPVRLHAQVTEARYAFDCPAIYRLNHPEITEVRSFTQTYVGQAEVGETVEIAGLLEESASGRRQVVVGSSREAPGEYIRVLR